MLFFYSTGFDVERIIFVVIYDLRLVGPVFGFKPTQLRGIMDIQLGVGLRIIVLLTKPAKLFSLLRPS